MLSQIPSSAPALFSLSPSLASIFLVAQVVVPFILSTLSAPKNIISTTPSRTIEIILAPTKCDLSSSSTIFPYVATMGFAAFIFVGLFCILRAKGFFARPHPANPSPPPAPDSNSSVQKVSQRSPWLWLVLLILALMAFGIFAALLYRDYKVKLKVQAPANAFVTSCVQSMSAFEGGFRKGCGVVASYIWSVVRHVFKRRWRYFKSILLAFTGHCFGALIVFAHRRLRLPAVAVFRSLWFPLSSFFVHMAMVASSVKLSWILWISYYFYDDLFPSINSIGENVISVPSYLSGFLGAPGSVDLAMVIGPLTIHAATMWLWTMVLIFLSIPSAFRALRLFQPQLLRFPLDCIMFIAGIVIWALFCLSVLQYYKLRPHVQQHVWQAFFSAESRAELWQVRGRLMKRHLHWKTGRIQEFHDLGCQLQRSFWEAATVCFETWGRLDYFEKMLIVVPVVIFYGHFHIIPAARKLLVTIRNRRRRHG